MTMEIVTVPCLKDNYAFLLRCTTTGKVAVVDVPELAPIENALAQRGWRLSDILITHHHGDHTEGVDALRASTGARVTGARSDAHRLPQLDLAVAEGDIVAVGALDGRVIEVPGHTVGHIAFAFPGAVFTGDSLMAMGCGRLFEGTAEQMWRSLGKIAALPSETLVYSGHEYTESNTRFAMTVEPDNSDLQARQARIVATRTKGDPTVPSTLSEELATNPFLRAGVASVKAAVGREGASDAEAFAEIRRRKDRF